MAEVKQAVTRGARSLSLRLAEKALMPIVAAAASAATGYVAKRVREAVESGVSAHAGADGTGAPSRQAGSNDQLEQRRAARARGRADRRKAIST